MLPLLHDQVQRLTRVLRAVTDALAGSVASRLDFADAAQSALALAGATYRALGLAEAENEVVALQAQLASVRNGLHPVTLERVTRYRRGAERAVANQSLQTASARLRADLARLQGALDDARDRLVPVVSVGLEKGLLPGAGPADPGQPQLEAWWRTLCADADLRAACRQLAMRTSLVDLLILLGDLLAVVRLATGSPAEADGVLVD